MHGNAIAEYNYMHYMNLYMAFGEEGNDAFNTRETDQSFLNAVHSRKNMWVVTVLTVEQAEPKVLSRAASSFNHPKAVPTDYFLLLQAGRVIQ